MWEIRELEECELEGAAVLEAKIFSDAWSVGALKETYAQNHTALLGAFDQERLIGYVIVYFALDEGEIARIAVDEPYRGRGVARALLEGLFGICRDRGVKRILLDVRPSNEAAVACYRKYGFVQDGVRRRFYADPMEDAVLMSRDVGK